MRNEAPQVPPTKYAVFADFSGGMDTQPSRYGLDEKKAAWMENLQPIAANKLLGVPGPAVALQTIVGKNIIKQFEFNFGLTSDYLMQFTSDGALYAVQNPGGNLITVAPAGTFSGQPPDCTTLGTTRLLIADSFAGYCTWDTVIFAHQGTVSPNIIVTAGGSGYSAPVVTTTGGSGSGDTYSVQLSGGSIVGITLLTPGTGFLSTDTLTVVITDGTGTGATANAHVWPFISPSPTTIGYGFGRVWIASGPTLICTGTGSSTYGDGYDDFLSADGSVTTTISDADLVHQITALRFLEGYLYIIGDGSVKFIGGVTVTSGVTNFTVTPLSSDQGTIYRDTIVSFNRLVLFANSVGVYAIFGASVEKISDPMDGIFQAVSFTNFPPSASVIDLSNIRSYCLLVSYNDPVQGNRSLILAFQNKKWFVINQGTSVQFIFGSIINGVRFIFSTSGSDVTQIMINTAIPVAYKLQTSLSPVGDIIHDKRVLRAAVAQTVNATSDMTVMVDSENGSSNANLVNQAAIMTIVNNAQQVMTFVNNFAQIMQFTAKGFVASRSANLSQTGRWIGATLTGTLNGIQIHNVILEFSPAAAWGKQ
jgi:hypothetical protein